MRRLSLLLACALVAPIVAAPPAHAHVRTAAGGTATQPVTAGLPLSVSPTGPRQVTLNNQGQGTLAGTLGNPNGFHRWGRPVQVAATGTSHPQCRLTQITIAPVAPPAAGAAVAPGGSRPWSVTVVGAGNNCRNATVTVTYPATQ